MNIESLKDIKGVEWLEDHPVKSGYDGYEIHPVRDIAKDSEDYDPENGTICEVCEPDDAEFWSVYGHTEGEGLECVADCETEAIAKQTSSILSRKLYNLKN